MAYLSEQDAKNGWLEGEEPENAVWFQAARNLAANLVQRYAPGEELDPVPEDYSTSAAAAELVVGGWLLENQGRYTSLSGPPGSISYAGLEQIKSLVEFCMPTKYLEGGVADPATDGSIIVTRGGPELIPGSANGSA